MSEIILQTGVRKSHKPDAYYCPHCGAFRETVEYWRDNMNEWFICPNGCENKDVDKRLAELKSDGGLINR